MGKHRDFREMVDQWGNLNLSPHKGSLVIITNADYVVQGAALWTSPYEFNVKSDIINYLDSDHTVILLRYSNDKSDAFVLTQFGVGWLATTHFKGDHVSTR